MSCGIYGIFNKVDGKVLVGQSVRIKSRLSTHFSSARLNKHCNPYFQAAFLKYGQKQFEWKLLEEVPEQELNQKEDLWISRYNSRNPLFGYNLREGGSHGRLSLETCRKMSASRMGMKRGPMSAERKLHLSILNTGKVVSEETRKKLSAANIGRKAPLSVREKQQSAWKLLNDEEKARRLRGFRSPAARAKHDALLRGRPFTQEHKEKIRQAALRRWAKPKLQTTQ